MPLQNRVTPLGDLIRHPARGLVYGNRGCLHDTSGHIRRSYNGRRWIACQLEFHGWHRGPLMQPGRFTELFFLDEATSFAAGHRPCALCRRADYDRFASIWQSNHPRQIGADAMDAQLHRERLVVPGGRRRLHWATLHELPNGAFVLHQGTPCLVLGGRLLRWTPGGYDARLPWAGNRKVPVLTPPSLTAVLRAGWQSLLPLIHPTAAEWC